MPHSWKNSGSAEDAPVFIAHAVCAHVKIEGFSIGIRDELEAMAAFLFCRFACELKQNAPKTSADVGGLDPKMLQIS